MLRRPWARTAANGYPSRPRPPRRDRSPRSYGSPPPPRLRARARPERDRRGRHPRRARARRPCHVQRDRPRMRNGSLHDRWGAAHALPIVEGRCRGRNRTPWRRLRFRVRAGSRVRPGAHVARRSGVARATAARSQLRARDRTPRQGSGPICILSPTPSVHAAVPEYAALWAFHDRCDRKSAPAQAWRELAVTGTETLQALQSMLQACSDRLDKADSDAWQCGLALLEIPSARVEARGPPTRPWCRSPALRSPSSTTCSSPSLTRRAKRPRSDDEEGLLRRIARASHVTAHTAPTRSPPRRMSRPIRASRTSIW